MARRIASTALTLLAALAGCASARRASGGDASTPVTWQERTPADRADPEPAYQSDYLGGWDEVRFGQPQRYLMASCPGGAFVLSNVRRLGPPPYPTTVQGASYQRWIGLSLIAGDGLYVGYHNLASCGRGYFDEDLGRDSWWMAPSLRNPRDTVHLFTTARLAMRPWGTGRIERGIGLAGGSGDSGLGAAGGRSAAPRGTDAPPPRTAKPRSEPQPAATAGSEHATKSEAGARPNPPR